MQIYRAQPNLEHFLLEEARVKQHSKAIPLAAVVEGRPVRVSSARPILLLCNCHERDIWKHNALCVKQQRDEHTVDGRLALVSTPSYQNGLHDCAARAWRWRKRIKLLQQHWHAAALRCRKLMTLCTQCTEYSITSSYLLI